MFTVHAIYQSFLHLDLHLALVFLFGVLLLFEFNDLLRQESCIGINGGTHVKDSYARCSGGNCIHQVS